MESPPGRFHGNLPRVSARRTCLQIVALCAVLSGCGSTKLIHKSGPTRTVATKLLVPTKALAFPSMATKNTTRVDGSNPVTDAAGVALAVYPSAAAGTHPTAVTIASTDDWQAAIASSVLMAAPTRAPILFAQGGALPPISAATLAKLAPTGAGSVNGAQVIRIGQVAKPPGLRSAHITGADPYTLAAKIDTFAGALAQRPSRDVVIASGTSPSYAMPAAGWAAESGDPVLFVRPDSVPAATRQALLTHQKPRIYVLGPTSVISDTVVHQLRKYGSVKRISANASTAPANSVAFASYRDPACVNLQPCAHEPGSFGWAILSPGHGYVIINSAHTLDAAAAAPLSASGGFGPQLLIDDPTTLPSSVQNYFLNYATPGYDTRGPTVAVFNHSWMIGDPSAVSVHVQAQIDGLLEEVPQK